jgi:alpha-mannosidase
MTGSDPDHLFHVTTRVPESSRVLVGGWADGMSAVTLGPQRAEGPAAPVAVSGNAVDNGLLRAEVGPAGTVRVTDLRSGLSIADALKVVDDGDRGDSYNYGPTDGSVSTPETVEVDVLERGPLRGRIRVRRTYRLPRRIDHADPSQRSSQTTTQIVDTLLELRADEPFLRVTVSLTNEVCDHRLRVLVPTLESGLPGSESVGQYGTTRRGREAEGGWGEHPLPTFPATRWISAGGVRVLLDKLVEYEVVDGEAGTDEIALTVLRSVGLMSVNVHPLRDEPAGSQVPVPGAQYLGRRVEFSFAIDLDPDGPVAHADCFRFTPVVASGRGGEPAQPQLRLQTEGSVSLE